MIDLGEIVIDEEANAVIDIWRDTGGSYSVTGKWQGNDADKVLGVKAVVQPSTGRRLMDLPEGVRNEARFFLWTREALATDDIVIYRGEQHRTVFVWPREEGGFTRAAIGLYKKKP